MGERIGFVGAGKDMTALKAAGVDAFYVGAWTRFQKRLQPGDTAVVTRPDRISRSPARVKAVTTQLANAGIGLEILDPNPTPRGGQPGRKDRQPRSRAGYQRAWAPGGARRAALEARQREDGQS